MLLIQYRFHFFLFKKKSFKNLSSPDCEKYNCIFVLLKFSMSSLCIKIKSQILQLTLAISNVFGLNGM